MESERQNAGKLVKVDDSLVFFPFQSFSLSSLCGSVAFPLMNQLACLQRCAPLLRVLRDN